MLLVIFHDVNNFVKNINIEIGIFKIKKKGLYTKTIKLFVFKEMTSPRL